MLRLILASIFDIWADIDLSIWADIGSSICADIGIGICADIGISICADICISICAAGVPNVWRDWRLELVIYGANKAGHALRTELCAQL